MNRTDDAGPYPGTCLENRHFKSWAESSNRPLASSSSHTNTHNKQETSMQTLTGDTSPYCGSPPTTNSNSKIAKQAQWRRHSPTRRRQPPVHDGVGSVQDRRGHTSLKSFSFTATKTMLASSQERSLAGRAASSCSQLLEATTSSVPFNYKS